MDNAVLAADLNQFGRAYSQVFSQTAADEWCQQARRAARGMGRPFRTWTYHLGVVWHVNAVIEDWPSTAAERRALREWESRTSQTPER